MFFIWEFITIRCFLYKNQTFANYLLVFGEAYVEAKVRQLSKATFSIQFVLRYMRIMLFLIASSEEDGETFFIIL